MNTGMVASKNVETCANNATILQAAELMRNEHVGDLVVVEYRSGKAYPIGIITDRDIVIEVMAMQLDPSAVTVGDVMSRKLIIANEAEDLELALERMRGAGVRRVPLVNTQGILVGIITIDDIIEKLAFTLAQASHVGLLQSADERVLRR